MIAGLPQQSAILAQSKQRAASLENKGHRSAIADVSLEILESLRIKQAQCLESFNPKMSFILESTFYIVILSVSEISPVIARFA